MKYRIRVRADPLLVPLILPYVVGTRVQMRITIRRTQRLISNITPAICLLILKFRSFILQTLFFQNYFLPLATFTLPPPPFRHVHPITSNYHPSNSYIYSTRPPHNHTKTPDQDFSAELEILHKIALHTLSLDRKSWLTLFNIFTPGTIILYPSPPPEDFITDLLTFSEC